jgi:hypothetical protein
MSSTAARSDRARSLKHCSFSAASALLSQTVKPSPSAARTGDTVMSVNPNKTKMNAQDVILKFCNIESSLGNYDYRFSPFNEKIRSGAIRQ